ncbi:hypothetical protein RS9916_27329 [Synechococcus sp. RS9916]|nr:hypothetical protein RS9916_27329 [Synechococcus sp. RS9916]
MGPDQCVGQAAGMKHAPTTTGASDALQSASLLQPRPATRQLLLMMPQGQPGPRPGVEAKHRRRQGSLHALLQEPGIERHLFRALELQLRQQQAAARWGGRAGCIGWRDGHGAG